jgi:hypothetical protein
MTVMTAVLTLFPCNSFFPGVHKLKNTDTKPNPQMMKLNILVNQKLQILEICGWQGNAVQHLQNDSDVLESICQQIKMADTKTCSAKYNKILFSHFRAFMN